MPWGILLIKRIYIILAWAAVGFCIGYVLGANFIPNIYCVSLTGVDDELLPDFSLCENSFWAVYSKELGWGLGMVCASLFGWMARKQFYSGKTYEKILLAVFPIVFLIIILTLMSAALRAKLGLYQ